ncbi:MAG: hypothetical protein AMJ89_05950 [candidate division Zixibacteria bacterium SM23_73]|nr:MAG: hypothetical protein AMJ89_05950 [candidate division Zixibacteria bacterium SM23_73]
MIKTKEKGIKVRDIGKFKKKFDALMDAPLDVSFGHLFEMCINILAMRNVTAERAKLAEQLTEPERIARVDEMASLIEMLLWTVMTTWMGWKMKDSYVLILREAILGRAGRESQVLLETMPSK